MHIRGEHDVRSAQPRRRRDDPLSNSRRINVDHGGVFENPRSGPPRQGGQTVHIFPTVNLKRLRIIDAMEITIGLDLLAHAIDLPSLHFRIEVLAERLQTPDQSIAYVDVGQFERPVAPVNSGNQLFGRMRPDEFGALLRQGPDFARVFKTDTRDQVSDWNT